MSALHAAPVNRHYLEKVMSVAEVMEVEVIVDILDVRGLKLVAKGTQVTRALQEKLILHKLRQPFESCVRANGSVDARAIVAIASRLIDTSPSVAHIVRATSKGGASVLAQLGRLEFGSALEMMLTVADRSGAHALEHAVLVSLLSICMAQKQGLSEQDQMVAGLSGMLHDIGELYIAPAHLARGRRLLPHEWSHVVVHPRIGQMLIDELGSYPFSVGRAVAEHHERFDGSGYPRQICGDQISAPGQAVAVAEMIAGLLLKDHPLERAELALKIIPGEHSHQLLSAISGALRMAAPEVGADPVRAQGGEGVGSLFARIAAILDLGEGLTAGTAAKSASTLQLLRKTMERVRNIRRAFISTGLDVYLRPEPDLGAGADHMLLFEREVACREIQWRLRDIARDLALQTTTPDERLALAPLVRMLDDDLPGGPIGEAGVVMPLRPVYPGAGMVSVRRYGT
ncbi:MULTISPECIES: HD-GYP domain-containing protein [unclassified Duganella]|uniref:HD-GYP domain-containing protein n=1 Tax=unclassified Duganella TaxID=2636909 RepID=UPI000E34B0AB|nr:MULTISPECIES: HD domain-containing phosphohydrolase [unclassified Duganella]RFP18345.1 HD domain-containing protein [Duganella sp. BJB475]RFP35010.1 HD domain-containing protein [Duganella sp. BJB476]